MVKIELIDINKLKPNPQNPRTIKDSKFKKLIQSLKDSPKMLEIRPVVYNSKFMILGGLRRWEAAKALKYKQVPAINASHLTPKEQKEFIIKDNLQAGEWDTERLRLGWDVDKLNEWGLDYKWTVSNGDAKDDGFKVPVEVKTSLKAGDLIQIGDHRLICGDSTQEETFKQLLEGKKAEMVFTDPPYNINYGNIKHPKFKVRNIKNDNMHRDEFKDFCDKFIKNIADNTSGCVYVCGAPGPDGRIIFLSADRAMHCSTVVIWNKDQFTLGRGKYQNKYEPIWFGWVESGGSFYGDRKQTNVWDIPRPKSSNEHPTMKPVELVGRAITHASKPGQSVMDLFVGSGTTMVAAEQLKRISYSIEIEPKYCQITIDRMAASFPDLKVLVNGKAYK